MANPFRTEALEPDSPFCDRGEELAKLKAYAESGQNVLLHSPRRYGKTSLCRRLQHQLEAQGYVCVAADFFGVDSVEEVARRLARAVAMGVHRRQSLADKGRRLLAAWKAFRLVLTPKADGTLDVGVEKARLAPDPRELLDNTLQDLAAFIRSGAFPTHMVLDEFQEVTRLREAALIEGLMRGAIQGLNCSFVFAGSRRGVIRAMFEERTRPFFQSAVSMELPPLPVDDAVAYVVERFRGAGREIDEEAAREIVTRARRHPFYLQRIASEVYAITVDQIAAEDVDKAYRLTIQAGTPLFEAILAGLTPPQIGLLRAIALHQPGEITGKAFSQTSGMQPSTISYAKQKLLEEDLVEFKDGLWCVVDPVFGDWLREI